MLLSQMPSTEVLDTAREKAGEIQHELEVASAELGLTHGALHRNLPPQQKTGDVAWALEQNAAVERKIQQAAEDLEKVQDLIDEARTGTDG